MFGKLSKIACRLGRKEMKSLLKEEQYGSFDSSIEVIWSAEGG
jgi:hypothetical protein